MQQREKYDILLNKALEAEKAYYEDDNPVLTDGAYDAIVRQLAYMEGMHPDWKSEKSPTGRVGGMPTNTFEKVQFPYRMLSLKNAFDEEDIYAFVANTQQWTNTYLIQPKLDGLTLVLYYEHGFLVRAATRGNGSVGEDVTLNVVDIDDIPKQLAGHPPDNVIVRGEAVMHKADFEELNAQLTAMDKQPYANPRNVAAGTIRQKDPAIASTRKIHFYAYDIPGNEDALESWMLATLDKWGFTTPATLCVTSEALMNGIMSIKSNEDSFPFAIDGAVVKCEQRAASHANLGEGTHDPNWAIAYKFTPEEAITTLKGVIWQIGRKGTMTPVAVLEPVELCGSIVERASLHNVSYITEMGLRLGDIVSVYKAAEIIPQLDHVVEAMSGAPVPIPKICPDCGAELVYDGAALLCPNEDCTAKIKAEICYFVSRVALDIRGMATAMIDKLVDAGKLHSSADLYALNKADLQIPGISKDLKADAVLAEIEKSKQKPFDRVLCAIGLDGVGTTNALYLANTYGNMDALSAATPEQLATLDGFAEVSAKALYSSLHSWKKQALIDALKAAGLQMTQQVKQLASNKLTGLSFCITGALSQSRDQIKKLIEDNGGKFVSSVSSATSYLIAGTGGGSKRTKAEKLGITIITEQQLKEMIQCQ